ncbi:MAG: hypothetical protein Q8M98_09905 [Candidatus Cloacimonadaceae bacterium]|nr:hypothetical protein [Candidatus Cloacimonadaceae bacterium]
MDALTRFLSVHRGPFTVGDFIGATGISQRRAARLLRRAVADNGIRLLDSSAAPLDALYCPRPPLNFLAQKQYDFTPDAGKLRLILEQMTPGALVSASALGISTGMAYRTLTRYLLTLHHLGCVEILPNLQAIKYRRYRKISESFNEAKIPHFFSMIRSKKS